MTSLIFPDCDLARRLERHEAWSTIQHAETQAKLYPKTGTISKPIADGWAVFCGAQSPNTKVYGLGLSAPLIVGLYH